MEQNSPPTGYEGVWPPAPVAQPTSTPPAAGPAFPFKTEFRFVEGSVPLFRSGTFWLSPAGIAIRGKAVTRYEIQIPILIASILFGAGWLIAYMIMEYAIRTDAGLDVAWNQVRQIVLMPKKRRVCVVYEAPNYQGVLKTFSLTTALPSGQFEAFVAAASPYLPERITEGKLRNWTSPVVWVVCAGILLGLAIFGLLFAVGSLAPSHPGQPAGPAGP